MAFAGDGGVEPAGIGVRLDRLAGSLGGERFRLDQPLTLTRRGADLAFAGLALRLGSGRIAGSGGIRGEALSLDVNGADLAIAPAARLFGRGGARGALSFSAIVGGNFAAPRGRLTLNARDLALSAAKHGPSLGLAVTGDWNGRDINLAGRVTGLRGDSIALTGSVPLLLTREPLGVSVPPQGRLALRVQGAGQIDHLADLLPLGEDRLTGRFAVDLSVGGVLAAPDAEGRLTLSDARYENFASGAVLSGLRAELVGNRDRLTLTSLSAGDGGSGKLEARGAIALGGGSGPSADLSGTLTSFRIAARDEAVVSASGRISVTGPLASPKVAAPLTIDRAEINLPQRLPPNIVVLRFVEVNGKTGKPAGPAEGAPPALPVALDIALDMPGRVFVRGHGLDSEWRGRLTITGTSAAPVISGSLEPIRGSFDVLGKSFRLARGAIVFDGSAKLDPSLDITAEVSAADITAQVVIGGLLSAPTVSLTSTPVLPQDEILSRVLFNRGVGRITAAEGIQLAQAAAALTGGGPDVLGRLRSGLGLDWLRFGSGPLGAAAGIFNRPTRSGSATSGNALSAGKYIAEGVSVGVTQGISPPTSKVTVEIQLTPRLTLGTEAGQNSGTGVSLNYNYDY